MLTLATGGHPAFGVHAAELDRGGVSWTVDTLQDLSAADPENTLLLILGPENNVLENLDVFLNPAHVPILSLPHRVFHLF
jgi:nicotinate-nucleotide adenylyltransferase